ncbi:MAG: ATP-binding cassette domain-containing protein [Thermoplasmata archaeon]
MTTWKVEGVESQLDGFHLGPVDLELGPGRAVAALGSSGAGKTTLLRTLAGFLPARSGRIVRDGVDITDWMPEERGLGYVPQGLGLFAHRTVERNVRFPLEVRGRRDARARTQELLERFHLTPLQHRYPARLSGGELQRVAIARALAAEPELIVWDEPWQALDVEARYELGQVLQELRETDRVPVLVVTHDPGLAFSLADRFLVLRRGRVAWQGDAGALLDHPFDGFSARFVGLENVFDRPELEARQATPFIAWLLERAGEEGVAFGRPLVAGPPPGGAPAWGGAVRSVRPTPEGLAATLDVGGLSVAVRLAHPWPSPLPSVGTTLPFVVDATTLHPLGDVALATAGAG